MAAPRSRYSSRNGTGTLRLIGQEDIFEAQGLLADAKRAVADADAPTVILDAKRLERMDVTAIQIILALVRDLRDQGRGLEVRHLNPSVRDSLARLGCAL